ncbi:MAG: hypothetical protein O3A00_23380 [Planctomycetota bacterium]|nr:hypothetical protein [Planctomycetota bacterium]
MTISTQMFALATMLVLAMTGCSSPSRHAYIHETQPSYSVDGYASPAPPTAMDNHDVIKLSAAGVSNELILRAVESRGGRFDLSPDGIIQLSQSGVPDDVITSIQGLGERESTPIASTMSPIVRGPSTTAVFVVAPRPPMFIQGRFGPPPRHIVHGRRRHFH